MAFFNEFDPQSRQEKIELINQRWGQLHGLGRAWLDNVVKYLFYINSGGAVAILTYIGTKGANKWSVHVLGAFVLGVIFLGLFHAFEYHKVDSLFAIWRVEVRKFFNNQIEDIKLHDDDNNRSEACWVEYFLPWACFVCFLWGAFWGWHGLSNPLEFQNRPLPTIEYFPEAKLVEVANDGTLPLTSLKVKAIFIYLNGEQKYLSPPHVFSKSILEKKTPAHFALDIPTEKMTPGQGVLFLLTSLTSESLEKPSFKMYYMMPSENKWYETDESLWGLGDDHKELLRRIISDLKLS